VLLVALLAAVACAPGVPTPVATRPTTPGFPSVAPVDPTAPGEAAILRVLNLYLDEERVPADVALFPAGRETSGEPPLRTIPYGSLSDEVRVPAGTALRVVAADHIDPAHVQPVTGNDGFRADDRATLITYRQSDGAEVKLGRLLVRERGAGAFEGWPPVPSDAAILLIFPGALLAQPTDEHAWHYVDADASECLIDAETGEPLDIGFGGNVPEAFRLEPGITSVAAARGCGGVPAIGPIDVEVEPGGRYLLLPYPTPEGDLEMTVIELGADLDEDA
jgi:hypothetical protein